MCRFDGFGRRRSSGTIIPVVLRSGTFVIHLAEFPHIPDGSTRTLSELPRSGKPLISRKNLRLILSVSLIVKMVYGANRSRNSEL